MITEIWRVYSDIISPELCPPFISFIGQLAARLDHVKSKLWIFGWSVIFSLQCACKDFLIITEAIWLQCARMDFLIITEVLWLQRDCMDILIITFINIFMVVLQVTLSRMYLQLLMFFFMIFYNSYKQFL